MMRTAHTTARIGGIGNANPHQRIAPKGKSTRDKRAPAFAPLQSSHPATHSSKETSKNADSKGAVV
jgi:hypothetical protein